ncbi:MAG: hypothetical protein EYC68_14965 [Chloroflexota bacterium]|nr:MAG: hypothetical protein EYC68_14965 [Chloroflexota bacterium]
MHFWTSPSTPRHIKNAYGQHKLRSYGCDDPLGVATESTLNAYAVSIVEIVGGIDMIVGGGVGGAVTCPVTLGGGCVAGAGAVVVGAAGVVHGGAVLVRNLNAPILRAEGRGFDDILSDNETFMRWLVRGHPSNRPLSVSQARAVWDKLLELD